MTALGDLFISYGRLIIQLGKSWHQLLNWLAGSVQLKINPKVSAALFVLLFFSGASMAFIPLDGQSSLPNQDEAVRLIYLDSSVAESKILYHYNRKDNLADARVRMERYLTRDHIKGMYRWIELAEKHSGIDRAHIVALIMTESNFDVIALSDTGPQGLMQVAKKYHLEEKRRAAIICSNGKDDHYVWRNPCDNIVAGSLVLRKYLDLAKGDVIKAHLLYHDGPDSKLLKSLKDYNGLMIFQKSGIVGQPAFEHMIRVMRRVVAYRMHKAFKEVTPLVTDEQLSKFRSRIGMHQILIAYK